MQLTHEGGLMGQPVVRVDSGGDASLAYVHEAVDFIMANLTESLSVDEIAAAAGVSKRTLHAAFQVNFGLSVMTFVIQRRLRQANQQLLDADVDSTTVTDIAMNSGFLHLGRFSSAYRKRFGEYPSETLQRRQSGAGTSIGGHQTTPGAV